jgi:putative DNA primase/helicase
VQGLITVLSDNPAYESVLKSLLVENEHLLENEGFSSETQRAIKRFAAVMLAGQLAVTWGVLPLTHDEVFASIKAILAIWQSDCPALSDDQRGLLAVRDFLLKHPSRFVDLTANPQDTKDLAGYKDKAGRYLLTTEGFKEACDGLDTNGVLKALKTRSLLHQNNGTKLQSKVTLINGQRVPLYSIEPDILAVEDDL